MSRFTSPLVIEEVQPGRRWRLREPIRYEAGEEGSGRWIEAPAGFETDGASIPPALRTVLAVWGTYGRAAALHDYLYSILRAGAHRQYNLWDSPEWHPAFSSAPHKEGRVGVRLARRWADQEFHSAMLACGTSRPLALLIWAAVRLFGRL